jgi:hypothetical protein
LTDDDPRASVASLEVVMVNARHVLYVTEHYAHLQGLRLVPLGVCFLCSGAWRAGLMEWVPGIAGRGARAWFVASLAVALGLSLVIRARYRRHGAVRPRATTTGAVTLSVCFVSFVIVGTLPPNAWQISAPALLLAFALAYLGVVADGLRRHYLVIALACLVFACAPLMRVPLAARNVALDLLIGMGLIAAGVGDHVALQRVLHAPEGVEDAGTA